MTSTSSSTPISTSTTAAGTPCAAPMAHCVPTFPRARYYYQRGELAHAHQQHERDRVSYLTDNYDPLVASGRATLLNGDAPIVPGIRVQLFPGHTEYHQAVIIESQNKKAAYVGDLIPTSAHLHPTWVMGYDLSPIDCIDNRHRYYRDAIPERWLTIFTHDPATPWAYISRDAAGRYFAEPVQRVRIKSPPHPLLPQVARISSFVGVREDPQIPSRSGSLAGSSPPLDIASCPPPRQRQLNPHHAFQPPASPRRTRSCRLRSISYVRTTRALCLRLFPTPDPYPNVYLDPLPFTCCRIHIRTSLRPDTTPGTQLLA